MSLDVYLCLRGLTANCGGDNFEHPGASEMLEELVDHYSLPCRNINNFINSHDHNSLLENYVRQSSNQPRKYLASFCAGLRRVIEPYFNTLSHTERKAMSTSETLLELRWSLAPYEGVLESVSELCTKLSGDCPCGCQLLSLLWTYADSVSAPLAFAYSSLLQHCHTTLAEHMTSWVLYGRVDGDPGCEFFIQAIDDEDINNSESHFITHKVVAVLIPSYIPPSLAMHILHIGHCLALFRKEAGIKADDWIAQFQGRVVGQLENALKCEAREWAHPMNVSLLQNTVQSWRGQTDKRLWHMLTTKWHVNVELVDVLQMFLLSLHDLFLEWCEQCLPLLNDKPGKHTSIQITNHMHIIYADRVPTIKQFSMQIVQDQPEGITTGWEALRLKYEIKWPTNILMGEEVVESLVLLHTYLVNVRRVTAAVQGIYICQRDTMHWPRHLWIAMIELRMELVFVLQCIESFVVNQVVGRQFTNVVHAVHNCDDVAHAVSIVSSTVRRVVSECCLDNTQIMHPIHAISTCARQFCQLFALLSGDPEKGMEYMNDLQKIHLELRQESISLVDVLGKSKATHGSSVLDNLRLTLNYNKFYSPVKVH